MSKNNFSRLGVECQKLAPAFCCNPVAAPTSKLRAGFQSFSETVGEIQSSFPLEDAILQDRNLILSRCSDETSSTFGFRNVLAVQFVYKSATHTEYRENALPLLCSDSSRAGPSRHQLQRESINIDKSRQASFCCSENFAAVVMDPRRILYFSISINTTVGCPPVQRPRHLLTRYSIYRRIPSVMLFVKCICKAPMSGDGFG